MNCNAFSSPLSDLLVTSRYFDSSIKSFITSEVFNEWSVKSLNSFLANNCLHALDAVKYRLREFKKIDLEYIAGDVRFGRGTSWDKNQIY